MGRVVKRPIIAAEFHSEMILAAEDVNHYADLLWKDDEGKSYPLRTDFHLADPQMRELCNLFWGRAPVLSQQEVAQRKLVDGQGMALPFNLKPSTWDTLYKCMSLMDIYDISNRFDAGRINNACSKRYMEKSNGKLAKATRNGSLKQPLAPA